MALLKWVNGLMDQVMNEWMAMMIARVSTSPARPSLAKRMECVEFAPAFDPQYPSDSGSKLHALHTLREVPSRPHDRPNDPAV